MAIFDRKSVKPIVEMSMLQGPLISHEESFKKEFYSSSTIDPDDNSTIR
jgi:hypothetical protein